jgi:hypothetical protein
MKFTIRLPVLRYEPGQTVEGYVEVWRNRQFMAYQGKVELVGLLQEKRTGLSGVTKVRRRSGRWHGDGW